MDKTSSSLKQGASASNHNPRHSPTVGSSASRKFEPFFQLTLAEEKSGCIDPKRAYANTVRYTPDVISVYLYLSEKKWYTEGKTYVR